MMIIIMTLLFFWIAGFGQVLIIDRRFALHVNAIVLGFAGLGGARNGGRKLQCLVIERAACSLFLQVTGLFLRSRDLGGEELGTFDAGARI